MNYYILPKINNTVIVNPIDSSTNYLQLQPYISQSLSKYYTESNKQIKSICENDNTLSYEGLIQIVNPYEYVFSKVPGSKFSVSKLKPQTNLFSSKPSNSFWMSLGLYWPSASMKPIHSVSQSRIPLRTARL